MPAWVTVSLTIFYVLWLCAVLVFLYAIWRGTTRYMHKMERAFIESIVRQVLAEKQTDV